MTGQSGTLTVPVSGFPAAQVSTNSSSVLVPSGASAYLNAGTPFGAAYGSSKGEPYLALRTASGLQPSNTVITFATPPAAGTWAFALGDVDADLVRVEATDPAGNPVPTADLGFQGSFNYCQGSPLPPACAGSQSTDLPAWNAGTATLTGSGGDTNGASGWLRPRVPIKSLTLRFQVQTGIPIYQLWLAAIAQPVAPVTPVPPSRVPTPPVTDPSGTSVEIAVPPAINHGVQIVTPPLHGSVTSLPNGNLLYTPVAGFTGTDSFKYRGHTRSGQAVIRTVTVDVVSTLPDTGSGQSLWLLATSATLLALGASATVAARRQGTRRF
jgi:Bacterial Ig domain